MSKFFWLGLGCVVAGVAFLAVIVERSEYRYPHPSGERVVITPSGSPVPEKVLLAQKRLQQAAQEGRLPRAVAEEREYDFGVMNPLTMGRHTFVIRNEGQGPLQLAKGGTTCKCTLSKVSEGIVEPGGQAEVTLEWNTGRHSTYSHGATIKTNDPNCRTIGFRVKGAVRTRIGSTRGALVFAQVDPDTAATIETVVYSQMWSDLPLADVSCSLEGATWEIEPAGEERLKPLEALAGYVVRVTTPDNLPSGNFQGVFRLEFAIPPEERLASDAGQQVDTQQEEARQETEEQVAPEVLELALEGRVPRRLAVYGPEIETDGTVDFGLVNEGRAKKVRLLMKVRDREREISVKRVDVRPEFVQVTITPFGGEDRRGMYYLDLEIPADAPRCHHLDVRKLGELHIEIDHPRIDALTLKLRLAVVPGGI